jgi:hypothetical protein
MVPTRSYHAPEEEVLEDPMAPDTMSDAAPAAAPNGVSTYWAAGSRAFHDLDEIHQAIKNGSLTVPRDGSGLEVQKLTYADAATIQKGHRADAMRSLVSAGLTAGAGFGLNMLLSAWAPIHFLSNAAFLAGAALSVWNGCAAYNHFQAAKATVYDGYMTTENGRITQQAGTAPPQLTYQAVNNKSFFNVIPDHPLAWRQAVPLEPAAG